MVYGHLVVKFQQNEGVETDRMLGDETAGHLNVYLPRTVPTTD